MKFVKRTLTGIVILLLSFICVSKGGVYLLIMNLFLSNVAIYELENVINKNNSNNININNLIINLLFNVSFNLSIYLKKELFAIALFCSFSLIEFTLYTIFDKPIKEVLNNYFMHIYITITFSLMYFISGTEYIWLIYICSWGTDTAAYCTGMLFGKHKLTKISPKKTIEGALGGIIGSMIIAAIFSAFYGELNIIKIVIITFFGSIISQIGDISASKIKRKANVKDYGNIFIGHGGVMDR
ncbi:MAG: phosphatidate cytidylyltransferase, partial [Anaerococcus vaginalis]|nr:phosphatidate cytidylyltransferase [Anaerococcus vaginalis]